jgi:vacuolar-type H+-ATPase subunit H
MASIMERIAEAEQKADAILEEANRTARERVTQAKNDAEEALTAADASERQKTADALLRAREEGERIAEQVTAEAKAETDALHEKAVQNVSEAVASLMERIEAAV